MPNWPELKIEAIINIVKDDEEIKMYFKDDFAELKKPHSKPFMMNIVNTVYPGLLNGLIVESSNQRHSMDGDAKAKEAIIMTDKWKGMLDASPYTTQ